MFHRIAVGDVMTRNFASTRPATSLHTCAKLMVKKRINSLPLTEGKKLVGFLTARNILWTLTKKPKIDLGKVKAIDIAVRKVAVIKPSADIGQALHKMKKYGFRRLPVLSRGELVGIITLKDILRMDPNLYPEIGDLNNVKEEARKLGKLSVPEEWDAEGLCDECDSFAPLLKMEGRLLCPDCRDELF